MVRTFYPEGCPRELGGVGLEDCPIAARGETCHTDIHHEFWPKKLYRAKMAKRFREFVTNKTVICRAAHNEIHATTNPPAQPSYNEMCEVVNLGRRNYD